MAVSNKGGSPFQSAWFLRKNGTSRTAMLYRRPGQTTQELFWVDVRFLVGTTFYQNCSAVASGAASVTDALVVVVSRSATATGAASLAKSLQFYITRTLSGTGTASLQRTIGKTFSASATAAASRSSFATFVRSFSAAVSAVPAVAGSFQAFRFLSASASALASGSASFLAGNTNSPRALLRSLLGRLFPRSTTRTTS